MRVLYALYAFLILFLTWRLHSDVLLVEVSRKAVIGIWIAALVAMFADWKHARIVALAAFGPVLGFLLFQSWSRLQFVNQNGGMDCPTCNGSPMAFLIGWSFEGAILLAGVGFCVWLVKFTRP